MSSHDAPVSFERSAPAFVAAILVYVTATSLWESGQRPFWFDEVFTAVLTRMPTFGDVVVALRDSADTSGPGYYVIQRALAGVVSDAHVAYRLSSVVATPLICLTLYIFARRDLPAISGIVAVFVVLASQLYHGYSVEARPYAVMVLGICVSALAWQRADDWRWRLVLIASVAATIAVHYYAVFALVPLGAAEAARWLRTRQLRLTVWAAFAGGGAALLALWPLLSGLRSYYGENYWSTPSIGKALTTYDTVSGIGFPGGGLGVALILCAVLLGVLRRSVLSRTNDATAWPPPETLVLIIGLIGLPFIAMVTSWVMNGGYTDRYALGVVPGLALGAAYASGALDPRHRTWLLAAILCVSATHELTFWGSAGRGVGLRQFPPVAAQQAVLDKAAPFQLPMMVGNGLDLVPLAYYNSDSPVEIVGVTDHQAAIRYMGSDSVDRDLVVLSRYMALRVETFEQFRAEHPTFLLMSRPGPFSWWTNHLLDSGYDLTAIFQQDIYTLYRVERGMAPAN